MNKRFQFGDAFFELPNQASHVPTQVIASKPETPEMLDPVAFMSTEPDLIAQYMASAPAEAELDDMAMWQAFTGKRSTLPVRWQAYAQGKQRHCGFNTWAMLFGPQWLLFHKMYLIALGALSFEFFFVWFAFSSYVELAYVAGSARTELLLKFGFLVAITIPRLVLGGVANIALFRKAKHEIAKIRDYQIDNKRKLVMITSAGSGSIVAIVVLYIAIGATKVFG